MRIYAIVFAMLLAVASVTTNAAYAKGRHHHRHHHHHHHHVPSAQQMKWHAIAGVLSLFAPLPITIAATSSADRAAAKVMRHARRHRH